VALGGAVALAIGPAALAKGPPAGQGNGGSQGAASPPAQAAPHQSAGNSANSPGHTGTNGSGSGGKSGSKGSGGGSSGGGQAAQHAAPQTQAAPQTRKAPQSGGSGSKRPSPQSGPDTGSGTPGSLNTDCTGHKDPRDPGSCQEKGRGNSFDRDPFRGPNRGDDCDEGGGNNITGEAVTNPHNADSPDDSDRGQGNNRCAARSTTGPETPPGTPGTPGNPGGPGPFGELPPIGPMTPAGGAQTATPGVQVAGESTTVTQPQSTTPAPGGVAGERTASGSPTVPAAQTVPVSDTTPSQATAPAPARSSDTLPFTGLNVLWLALAGLALGLWGARLRSALGRTAT
jgi:hypothetical protein